MSSFVYNGAKEALMKGQIDLENGPFGVLLVSEQYSPEVDGDEFLDDVGFEISGSGYSSGGKVLSELSLQRDPVNDRIYWDASDVTWPLATFAARAAVIFSDSGEASTSMLLAYIDFGEEKSSTGEDFTIEWDTKGILFLGD